MLVYHRTDHAAAILADGFEDGEGNYLTLNTHRGVWVADFPLDVNDGAIGEHVLALEIPEEQLIEFEWVEEHKGYREFLVPASVLNGHVPALLAEAEIQAIVFGGGR
jgi:hypothetical protein